LQVYYPKTKRVEIYDLGKRGAQVDQFLLLGFGISGKELQKSYSIKATGTDTIGGKPATKLELIPKSKDALEYLKKVELWIPPNQSYPVQEKIYKNSQDYILINYSDVRINPGLTDKELELSVPPGVTKVYPQK
jgi:outer membrane lipoprotein-sorting protein